MFTDRPETLPNDFFVNLLDMRTEWNAARENVSRSRSRHGPFDGLVRHSDRGVQYLSVRYTERLAEAGVVDFCGQPRRLVR